MRILTVSLIALLLTACASEGADVTTTPTGRVAGRVLAGPTCPVVIPDDPRCDPAPVDGTVEVWLDGRAVASAPTDATGHFSTSAPEGTYRMTVDVGGRAYPVCEAREVRVVAGAETIADISCDTGIR